MFFFRDLNLEEGRQLAERDQLAEVWRAVEEDYVDNLRGSMIWRERSSGTYLYRKYPDGREVCLGARSRETDALAMEFRVRKHRVQQSLAELKPRLASAAGGVRARNLGRLPAPHAAVLEAVFRDGVDSPFRLVGTGALLAYEALASGRLGSEILATGDLDLLLDPRRRVAVLAEEADGGLLGRLRSADPTFSPISRNYFSARSATGFQVDVLEASSARLWAKDRLPRKGKEMRPVVIEGLTWLRDVPAQVAWISTMEGRAVQVRVADARAFALHKWWLSSRPDRASDKRPKDRLQALASAWMACRRMGLQSSPDETADLGALPAELRQRLPSLVQAADQAVQTPAARPVRVRRRPS